MVPVLLMISRISDFASASSAHLSARMSRAPARASSGVGTALSLSSLITTYWLMMVFGSVWFSQIMSASGSRPRSFAIVARVLRLGLNGANTSSRRVMVSAVEIFLSRSGLRRFLSSRLLMMALRRRSSSASCCILSLICVMATSSSSPVASLR